MEKNSPLKIRNKGIEKKNAKTPYARKRAKKIAPEWKNEIQRLKMLGEYISKEKKCLAARAEALKQQRKMNVDADTFDPAITSIRIFPPIFDDVYFRVISPIKQNDSKFKDSVLACKSNSN